MQSDSKVKFEILPCDLCLSRKLSIFEYENTLKAELTSYPTFEDCYTQTQCFGCSKVDKGSQTHVDFRCMAVVDFKLYTENSLCHVYSSDSVANDNKEEQSSLEQEIDIYQLQKKSVDRACQTLISV